MDETTTLPGEGDTHEKPNVSNGVAVYESWDEMMESWEQRAIALADEMAGFGFASFWLTTSYDKLADDGASTQYRMTRRGNYYTVLGMLTGAANDMMNPKE